MNRLQRFSFVVATIICAFGAIARADAMIGKVALPKNRVEPASGGQIWIKVSPSHLIMGENGDARVEAILPRGSSNVVFFAAHGRVGNVAMQSPTRVTAKYYKPRGFLPRIDIIAALASVDGENRWGYAAVLLYGQGEAELKTHRGAEAKIRIGDQEYGPVKADDNGEATIQIIVPPGVQFGRDGIGRPIDLNVPITARTAVFAEKDKIAPEVDREIELFGVVTSLDGSPDEKSTLEITAEKGFVEDIHSIGSGAFIGRYTPPKTKKGEIQIESVVPKDVAPPGILTLKIVPPPWHMEQFTITDEQSRPSQATHPPVRLFLTPKIGMGWNPHDAVSFHFAGDVGTLFPIGNELFTAALELGTSYSAAEDNVKINNQSTEVDWSTWFLSVLACVGWHRELTEKFTILLGIQGGFLYLDNKLVFTPKSESGSKTTMKHETIPRGLIGANISFGWRLGPGTLIGDLRVLWGPGYYETMNATFSSIIIDVGYRIWFL